MDNFKVTDLAFDTDEETLAGALYLPNASENGKRLPTVLYAPELGKDCTSGDVWARELAKRGYVVFSIDFSGGANSKSTGDALELTCFTEQNDLERVYNELVKKPYVDANNVFLMGAGLGGVACALAAAKMPNFIKGLILLYPAFSVAQQITGAFKSPSDLPDTYELFGTEVGRAFLESLYGFDLYNVIGTYQGPVLLLHGTGDTTIASGYSVKAVSFYRQARLELISDAVHGFEGGYFKYATRVIVDFLDEETDLADESGIDGDLNFGGPGMGGMGMGL
jgi:dipeptidyl aminopeptidase/acylaminoacyl peptidase